MKRGESGINALIAIDKPLDITSHDVVDRVRRIVGERRVGHCGTLDPAASGVLLVGVGSATRLSPYLTGHDKTYEGRVAFGFSTDTDDADGRVLETAPVPDLLSDPAFAASFVEGLVGSHTQVPPAFCAIKRNGVTAYRAAREGEALELDPRAFSIERARLTGIDVDATEGEVVWQVELSVSKGTYIRAIARDLGEALDTRAHLSGLRRLRSGRVGIEDAVDLEELEQRGVDAVCINPVTALGLPAVNLEEGDILPVYQGRTIDAGSHVDEGLCCLVYQNRLVSIHECVAGSLRPRTVFSGGVAGVC